jgi:D-glycero-D-manno-heptose 1,7-bisphosphate phosphatase
VSAGGTVFVDRDGVINELVPDPLSGRPESPLRPEDVRLIPGAADALSRLAQAGWLIVGISNQPAAAKGIASLEEVHAVQARVLELVSTHGVRFDDFRLCLHHPEGIVPELKGPCACRKPAPGMLLDSAACLGIELGSSWMVGDTDADVEAGRAAGCATILILHPGSAHKRSGSADPTHSAADLAAAADFILRAKG